MAGVVLYSCCCSWDICQGFNTTPEGLGGRGGGTASRGGRAPWTGRATPWTGGGGQYGDGAEDGTAEPPGEKDGEGETNPAWAAWGGGGARRWLVDIFFPKINIFKVKKEFKFEPSSPKPQQKKKRNNFKTKRMKMYFHHSVRSHLIHLAPSNKNKRVRWGFKCWKMRMW